MSMEIMDDTTAGLDGALIDAADVVIGVWLCAMSYAKLCWL